MQSLEYLGGPVGIARSRVSVRPIHGSGAGLSAHG